MQQIFAPELFWVQIRATDTHVQGYNGVVEPCLEKAFLRFQIRKCSNIEEMYFSKHQISYQRMRAWR